MWGRVSGVGCWALGVGCWVLGVGCWVGIRTGARKELEGGGAGCGAVRALQRLTVDAALTMAPSYTTYEATVSDTLQRLELAGVRGGVGIAERHGCLGTVGVVVARDAADCRAVDHGRAGRPLGQYVSK